MAEEIGALRALLTATSAVFEKDMKAARDSVRTHGGSMQKSLSDIGKKFGNVTLAMGKYAAAAGVAAATGFAYFLKTQIDAADKIGKVAAATGTTTEFISSMGYVAEQSGTSVESIADSMKKLSRNMGDAGRGTGEAKVAFENLNLALKNSDGTMRQSEAVLMDIADKFKALPDSVEKTELAMKLFGRSGADLIPMLSQGREGIAALQKQAQEMGLVISAETAAQAAYFNDELDRLKQEAVGVGRSIMVDMLPGLTRAVEDIRKAKDESGLLTAAWVALGSAAKLAFSKSTENQISQLTKQIEQYDRELAEVQTRLEGRSVFSFIGRKEDEARIIVLTDLLEKSRAKLAELGVQREKEIQQMNESAAASQKDAAAKQGALEKYQLELDAKRKLNEATAASEAQRKADEIAQKAAQKAIEGTIAALETQRITLGMTEEAATLYRISLMDGITPAQIELAGSILEAIRAQREQMDLVSEGKSVFDSTRTAVEKYAQTIARLQQLLAAGAIDQDTFNRGMQQAKEALEDFADKGVDKFKELERAIEGWGRSSASAIADFVLDGKKSFRDLAKSIIRDIMEMMIYQNMVKPLFSGLGGSLGGLFSGGGGGGYVPGAYGMANGGVINEPIFGIGKSGQTYTFGEGGISEAVVPLDGDHSVGGGSVNVGLTINAWDTATGAEQLMRNAPAVARALVDQLKHDPSFARFVRS